VLVRSKTDTRRQEKPGLDDSDHGRWFVIIHNDDVTPYDFVIIVLVRFFLLDTPTAELVTWTAHTAGLAQVSILPLAEATRRVGKAQFAANLEGYPLHFTIEPD